MTFDEMTAKMVDGLRLLAADIHKRLGVAAEITIPLGDVPAIVTPIGQVIYDPHHDAYDIWREDHAIRAVDLSREQVLARLSEFKPNQQGGPK